MPIHHVGLSCGPSTFKVMRDFYINILAPLGYTVFMEQDGAFVGFQSPRCGPDFWLHGGGEDVPRIDPADYLDKKSTKKPPSRVHVAFDVSSQRAVHEWYENAIKAGAIDNGKPGERPEYVKGYYAAFVIDPLGNNIEVVCFNPLWMRAAKLAPTVGSLLVGVAGGLLAYHYY